MTETIIVVPATNVFGYAAGPPQPANCCCNRTITSGVQFMHRVKIALSVNANSEVAIKQGCKVVCDTPTTSEALTGVPCEVKWLAGESVYTSGAWESGGGTWSRTVKDGTYLSICVRPINQCATGDCYGIGGSSDTPNVLRCFTIDEVDQRDYIQAVANAGGIAGCVRAGCGAVDTGCCAPGTWTTDAMPIGTLIVVGPISGGMLTP